MNREQQWDLTRHDLPPPVSPALQTPGMQTQIALVSPQPAKICQTTTREKQGIREWEDLFNIKMFQSDMHTASCNRAPKHYRIYLRALSSRSVDSDAVPDCSLYQLISHLCFPSCALPAAGRYKRENAMIARVFLPGCCSCDFPPVRWKV